MDPCPESESLLQNIVLLTFCQCSSAKLFIKADSSFHQNLVFCARSDSTSRRKKGSEFSIQLRGNFFDWLKHLISDLLFFPFGRNRWRISKTAIGYRQRGDKVININNAPGNPLGRWSCVMAEDAWKKSCEENALGKIRASIWRVITKEQR